MVFVGLQVRQSAEATKAATVLQLKDGWAQLNMTQMENPEILERVTELVYAHAGIKRKVPVAEAAEETPPA